MRIPAYFTRHAKPHQLGEFQACSATYSFCRNYRYTLDRVWSNSSSSRILLFIGLNPSTATHLALDPTVTRVVRRAKRMGYDALRVCNLFAFRATDPKDMRQASNPIGDYNDKFIKLSASIADTILVGWGNHGLFRSRDIEVSQLLVPFQQKVVALDVSKDGNPKHPLYLADNLGFIRFQLPTRLTRSLTGIPTKP